MPCLFGKYRDIFGRPGMGVHSYRVFGIAVVDFAMTIAFAVFIWWLFFYKQSIAENATMFYKYSLLWVCLFFILLGVVAHRLFCVNTTINKLIFGVVSA
jgi:hypothetical protein